MSVSKSILTIQNTIFNYVIFISYILYFIALLGISSSAPEYLEKIEYWVRIYISIFLIVRFNMFRKITFNYLDQKIAFHAGVFLLATTIIQQILMNYLDKIKSFSKKIIFSI